MSSPQGRELYRCSLLEQLRQLAATIASTEVLATIYGPSWVHELEQGISVADLTSGEGFRSSRCPVFMQLKNHPDFVRLLDSRLVAYVSATSGQKEHVARKLSELRSPKLYQINQLELLFEMGILGEFARNKKLKRIEVRVGESASTIDGLVTLASRDVFVEATLTAQSLTSSSPGVHCISVDAITQQVVDKLTSKAVAGRQLALVDSAPTVLFLGLHPFGADQIAAQWAIEECFASSTFVCLSAVVVTNSWKFLGSCIHTNGRAAFPLSQAELADLARVCDAVRAVCEPPADVLADWVRSWNSESDLPGR